jgi:hypothetical protein
VAYLAQLLGAVKHKLDGYDLVFWSLAVTITVSFFPNGKNKAGIIVKIYLDIMRFLNISETHYTSRKNKFNQVSVTQYSKIS